ncbi:MAG: ABC transporter ATP-binding protein [Cyanobacteria bacterium P01_A01_bin.3]
MPATIWNRSSNNPFVKLISLYKSQTLLLLLSLLFFILRQSPEWIRPLIVANIIDSVSSPSDRSSHIILMNGSVFCLAVILHVPANYIHARLKSQAMRGIESNLRTLLVRKIHRLSIGFLERHGSGGLHHKLMSDVVSIEQLANYLFQLLPGTVFTFLTAVYITSVKAPIFLLLFLFTVPVAALLIFGFRRPIRRRNQALRKEMEGLSGFFMELISMLQVTRAHGIEPAEERRADHKLDDVRRAEIHVDTVNALTSSSSWVSLRLFGAACLILSAWFALSGRYNFTPGSIILLTGYFGTLTSSVLQMLNILPQLGKGFEAIRSVSELLESDEFEQQGQLTTVENVCGHFTFRSVSYAYPDEFSTAIQDFSLDVEPGETIAIVGPSGAGKSTLIKLIIGFIRPSSGQILLDGMDIHSLDLRSYRRWLSVVSQETVLLDGSVADNICFGLDDPVEEKLRLAAKDANAFDFISQLADGFDTYLGENGTKLSGGQRQRIAIARAMIRDPKILVLDEATSSLDSASETAIQQALETIAIDRTTFIIAHRLSTIRNADRIVVMDRGQIVEVGNHAQLLNNQGIYAQLHDLQMSM